LSLEIAASVTVCKVCMKVIKDKYNLHLEWMLSIKLIVLFSERWRGGLLC